MFNHNLFLNEKQQEDLSVTVKNALEAWENGIFAWSAWVGEFLAHQSGVTLSGHKISDTEFLQKSLRACLSKKLTFTDVEMFEGAESGDTHLQMTAKLNDTNGTEEDYHICLTLAQNIFTYSYDLEIVAPELEDVTVCRCAERRTAQRLVPAFA